MKYTFLCKMVIQHISQFYSSDINCYISHNKSADKLIIIIIIQMKGFFIPVKLAHNCAYT